MISRKYVKDYTFIESVGENGRIKTNATYTGSRFIFTDSKRAKSCGKLLLWLCVLAWLAYILALLPRSAATKVIYIVLPFAFAALSLGTTTASAFLACRRREPLIRSDADKLSARLPGSALLTLLMTGIPLLVEGIMVLVSPESMLPGDAVFSAGAAVIFAVSAFTLSRRAVFKTREQ